MSRRGAGAVRRLGSGVEQGRDRQSPRAREADLQLIETPALGSVVAQTARALIRAGMNPPEVSSLFAHAAAQLAQQGPNELTRDEWLTLCGVLWDGPDGGAGVTAPGGDA